MKWSGTKESQITFKITSITMFPTTSADNVKVCYKVGFEHNLNMKIMDIVKATK